MYQFLRETNDFIEISDRKTFSTYLINKKTNETMIYNSINDIILKVSFSIILHNEIKFTLSKSKFVIMENLFGITMSLVDIDNKNNLFQHDSNSILNQIDSILNNKTIGTLVISTFFSKRKFIYFLFKMQIIQKKI